MNWDVIYSLVSQWYQTGLLAESDKPLLQAAYTELTGDTGERCRRCESYWSDVQFHLRYHLIKELGYEAMDNKNKYMISQEAGYLQVNGLPYVYVNKGSSVEGESAKHLTDEIAEQLLKENPDRAAIIVKNPDYNPEAAKAPATKPAGKPKVDPATAKAPAKRKAAAKSKESVKPETSKDSTPSSGGGTDSTPEGSQSEVNQDSNV